MAVIGSEWLALTLAAVLPASTVVRADGANAWKLPTALQPYLTEELVAIFEPGKFSMPADAGYESLEYRFFKPKGHASSPPDGYPLILFFNGHGRVQMNYGDLGPLKHLQATIFSDPKRPENYPFYLLAIRCPKSADDKWLPWFNRGNDDKTATEIEPIEAAMLVLDEVTANHSIDGNRISLLGISSGGAAAWELATRYPDRFSAIVPTACSGRDATRLDRIRGLPIWAFHSTGDNPEPIEETIAKLQAAGGNAHLTLVANDKHDCWTAAFQEHDLLKWMLAQSRNDQSSEDGLNKYFKSVGWHETAYPILSPRGRVQAWNELWPRVLPVLAMLVIALLYRRESRRRRLRATENSDQQTPTADPLIQESIHEESAAV